MDMIWPWFWVSNQPFIWGVYPYIKTEIVYLLYKYVTRLTFTTEQNVILAMSDW